MNISKLANALLVAYSCIATICLSFVLVRLTRVKATNAFDTITVKRINVVEPDGTPRLIIANKANYPGTFFRGSEVPRSDRSEDAGMLFLNDEGTENGGLIFDGKAHSWNTNESHGHLSFDGYEQDQTVVIEGNSANGVNSSGLSINDVGAYHITPQIIAEVEQIKAIPDASKREGALAAFRKSHPGDAHRAYLGSESDRSVGLALRDVNGRVRLVLKVDGTGIPSLRFLDKRGSVVKQIQGE